MPIYTIIGGVNGSGKSSLTGVLKAQRTDLGRIIDVDKLAKIHGGFLEGGRAALAQQAECTREGSEKIPKKTRSGPLYAR